MGGDWEIVKELRAQVESGAIDGPDIIAAGPFVDGAGDSPNFIAVTTAEEARAAVRQLGSWGVDFVKIQARLSRMRTPGSQTRPKRRVSPCWTRPRGSVPERRHRRGPGEPSSNVSPALPGDASLLLACSPRETELREQLRAWNAAARAPDPDRTRLREWQREIQSALLEECDAGKLDALTGALLQRGAAVVPTLVWSRTLRPLDADSVLPAGNADSAA